MAPTEVLAQQHFIKMTQALEPFGIACGYLAQGQTPEERAKVLKALEEGRIQVAIGTHALIQDAVKFKKLGLAIIDEQHKFGVFQRAQLKEKGKGRAPHFLLMTATPIPRTLAMTLYGDMDVSVIREMPKGRKPIKTMWVSEDRREEIYRFVEEYLAKGQQCYVICPLIESKGTTPQKSAFDVRSKMQIRFPKRSVDVLHGRQKAEDKKKIMKQFKDGKLNMLVSTVVIEVGIDVPNANLMIIENADRFGLSQLHQLRGRIGRGTEDSFCILFSDSANPETVERLGAFEEMASGFDIAEKDLEMRGAGEIAGEKQHGFPELRIGDLIQDMEILESARREAAAILEKDPYLNSPDHRKIRKALQARFTLQNQPMAALA
jgi:ATP-dependent DNA helicase RecG